MVRKPALMALSAALVLVLGAGPALAAAGEATPAAPRAKLAIPAAPPPRARPPVKAAPAPIATPIAQAAPAIDLGQCRLGCARAYYFCLDNDDMDACAPTWTTCRADCARKARAP